MNFTTVATTPGVFFRAGRWFAAGGIVTARSWGEVRNLSGSGLTAQMGVQITTDIRTPGSATLIGSSTQGSGMIDPIAATSLTTDTQLYIRPGWVLYVSSGTGFLTGAGTIEFRY